MIEYDTMPQELQKFYEKKGKKEGITGEQFYIREQKSKHIFIRNLFESKTREEINIHLSDVHSHLMDISDYLNIIDSPHAKEASKISGDFLNFISCFAILCDESKRVGWHWEEEDFCGRKINK